MPPPPLPPPPEQKPKESTPYPPSSTAPAPPPPQAVPPPAPKPKPTGALAEVSHGFEVVRSDVNKAGGELYGGFQTVRRYTQGPQLGTPAKYETVTTYQRGGPGAGLVPIQTKREIAPAQAPTEQQMGRRAAYVVGGLGLGGELVFVGEKAASGMLADLGGKVSLGAAFGGTGAALKGGTPTQIAESAALSGGLFAAGPLVGKAAGGISSRFGEIGARLRTPSTVESEFGTYSGIPRGEPGVLQSIKSAVSKPPKTPGYELTDIPAGEAPIGARSFGEVFAQKKFGIEPTPSVSYEFEYKGPSRPFEYSPVEQRQAVFGKTGPSGGGYGGGGGRGQVVTEQIQPIRTPPASPFRETERFREVYAQPSTETGPALRGITAPGAISTTLPSGVSGKVSVPTRSTFKGPEALTVGSGKTQEQTVGSGATKVTGSGVFTYQTQPYLQTEGTPPGTTPTPPPPTTTTIPVPSPSFLQERGASGSASVFFMQPPSLPAERGRRGKRFAFREIKHPISNILTGGSLDIPKGFRQRRKSRR